MKLTEKTKEDFNKWMRPDIHSEHRYSELITNTFEYLPQSMQYGVLVDFFDSVNIWIELQHYWAMSEWSFEISKKITYNLGESIYIEDCIETRSEARVKAIEKANEIYNKTK